MKGRYLAMRDKMILQQLPAVHGHTPMPKNTSTDADLHVKENTGMAI